MAAMHQDTSEDREVVHEKLEEIFGVKFVAHIMVLSKCIPLYLKGYILYQYLG